MAPVPALIYLPRKVLYLKWYRLELISFLNSLRVIKQLISLNLLVHVKWLLSDITEVGTWPIMQKVWVTLGAASQRVIYAVESNQFVPLVFIEENNESYVSAIKKERDWQRDFMECSKYGAYGMMLLAMIWHYTPHMSWTDWNHIHGLFLHNMYFIYVVTDADCVWRWS